MTKEYPHPAEIVQMYVVRCKSNHDIKYDCCSTLAEAEKAMEAISARMARIAKENYTQPSKE